MQILLNSNTVGVDAETQGINNSPGTDLRERTLRETFLSFLNFVPILEGITIVASSHSMSKEGRDFFSLENVFCLPLYSQGKDYPRSQFVACSAVQTGLL